MNTKMRPKLNTNRYKTRTTWLPTSTKWEQTDVITKYFSGQGIISKKKQGDQGCS